MGKLISYLQLFLLIRFERKRVEEDLDNLRRKAQQLKSQVEGSSLIEKLKQELKEYREILKCSVCLDRRKEVHSYTQTSDLFPIKYSLYVIFTCGIWR